MYWASLTVLLLINYTESVFSSNLNRFRRDLESDNAVIEIFNDCRCVFYYQCNANNTIITTGETIFDVRMKDVPRIKCKGGKFEGEIVCCKLNLELRAPDDEILVNNITKSVIGTTIKQMNCGIQRPTINVRIFAGENELTPTSGEFPWIAAIYEKHDFDYKFYCSGSLIHPKVILTANHYFHKKLASDFKVIVDGEIKPSNIGDKTDQERHILEIVNHPEYYAGGLYNDVALLILNEPYVVSRQNYVNTICLPPNNINLVNTKCLVAGWGKAPEEQSKKIMKKVELPLVQFDKCQDLLRLTRLGEFFNLHPSFMCAGGEKGKDACKGDGGSPLMCPLPSGTGYFQIGIVSWGVGCGKANVPGVYGNVANFKGWIVNELKKRQLEI